MLLIDLSAVVIGSVVDYASKEKEEISANLVRHITLNQILQYKKKYREYGEVVIAVDSKNYWRKDIFPFYKQNRKKSRDNSKIDWGQLFDAFNVVKKDLQEVFTGWTYVEVDRAEADDVIAVLAMRYSAHEPVMIVSSDKDMIQIQQKAKKGSVKQYSPSIKKMLTADQNDYSLIEHYIKGDASDGIPNILSDDDVFLDDSKRQKAIRKTMVQDAIQMKNPELICPNADALDKYKRNMMLVDIDYIPTEYKEAIVAEYDAKTGGKHGNLRNYFMNNRMKLLMQRMSEFL